MAYSACSLDPPGSGRQDRSSSAPPFLTRFLSGSHISAVFAHFSGLSPPFGSLVAYPVGTTIPCGSGACAPIVIALAGTAAMPKPHSTACAVPFHAYGRSIRPTSRSWGNDNDQASSCGPLKATWRGAQRLSPLEQNAVSRRASLPSARRPQGTLSLFSRKRHKS